MLLSMVHFISCNNCKKKLFLVIFTFLRFKENSPNRRTATKSGRYTIVKNLLLLTSHLCGRSVKNPRVTAT